MIQSYRSVGSFHQRDALAATSERDELRHETLPPSPLHGSLLLNPPCEGHAT